MGNNNLNKKVIENVRNRVVISNMEREEYMRLSKRKQILSVITVGMVMIGGSFITVNAATDAKLVEKVKGTIQVMFTNDNGKQEELEKTTHVNSNNQVLEKYQIEKDGMEYELEINKNLLNDVDSELKVDINKNNEEINLTMNYDSNDK